MNKKSIKRKRIDQILVEKGLVKSKNKAQAMVMTAQVYSGDKLVLKPGQTYKQGDTITVIKKDNNWVSRGAIKLEPIIVNQKIEIRNKICLDIGASTGGFSQVLLKYGAKKIYAIDVGYGQIHEKIKLNKRVLSFERTNARYLTSKIINENVDVLVCDTSFISLKKIINKPLEFLKKNGLVIALIKPQFEALKKEVKKGGVVKDSSVHERICNEIKDFFTNEKKLNVIDIIQSSIKGPKGNAEFFIIAIKSF